MPDCQQLWDAVDAAAAAVDLSAAAVDALQPAYDAAILAFQQDSQNLADAIEAALACETGQQWNHREQRMIQAFRSLAAGRRRKS